MSVHCKHIPAITALLLEPSNNGIRPKTMALSIPSLTIPVTGAIQIYSEAAGRLVERSGHWPGREEWALD